jgi:hypothetical protein
LICAQASDGVTVGNDACPRSTDGSEIRVCREVAEAASIFVVVAATTKLART